MLIDCLSTSDQNYSNFSLVPTLLSVLLYLMVITMAKLSLHKDFDRYHIAYKQEVQLTGIMISIIFLFEKCYSVIAQGIIG